MKPLLAGIFILIFASSSGQTKTCYNIVSLNGDTTIWYKYQANRVRKLSLASLDTSPNTEYFRVWTDLQVIEIWQNQGGISSGNIITWVDEYAPYKERPTNRTFSKVIPLSADTAKLVRQLFFSSGILILPTDDSIKGWEHGFDGITYFLESSTKESYSFKSYWTPEVQDSLEEAIQVQSFINSVFSLVNAGGALKSFVKTIPYESYNYGGLSVATKALTICEKKKYARERKKYRRHMHLQ